MEGGFNFDDDNGMKWSWMVRVSGFQKMKKVFRVVEMLMVVVFLTWAFNRLPLAGEYLRQLLKLVAGHLFVFLLTNIIVLFLVFKSHNLFLHTDIISQGFDPDRFIDNSCYGYDQPPEEELVYQDKKTILEVTTTKVGLHRRSLSENFSRDCGGCEKTLRRSETEMRRRVTSAETEEDKELSNEEFQRAIEQFIAKQVKFHQDEKLAIVQLHG